MQDTSQRKKDHIELCLTDKVNFKFKTAGFEKYDFKHFAVTELNPSKLDLSTKLFNRNISYPFMISCMTGGTKESESINSILAESANELNIPVGVGSQRQALENNDQHESYRIIRKKADKVPVLGNIGAAQISQMKNQNQIKFLIDLVGADIMVIHINPLQELVQKNGEPNFSGFLKRLETIINKSDIPFFVKEVGAGIGYSSAKKLLDIGVRGIDVAGAGGTSWSGVELLRNNSNEEEFWDWGLPTTYCIREVYRLKTKNKFYLIASGGIKNGFDIAKSIALGADVAASARVILQIAFNSGAQGVTDQIKSWFETVKKIMYLTDSKNLMELRKNKIIKKEELF